MPVHASAEQAESNSLLSDIVSMDAILNTKELFVSGYRGFLGKIKLSDSGAVFKKINAPLSNDFLVIRSLLKDEAVIGTARGEIYLLSGDELKLIAALSDFNEPILDISVKGDDIWAVGPRGLIAQSVDRGKSWSIKEIEYVKKTITLKSHGAETWFLGVSNIDRDSFVFNATVGGKVVVDDEDYYLDTDSGSLEIVAPLDAGSALSVEFNYQPGPQFQAGDVSLNTVSHMADTVFIAGEFGTAIVLDDDGNWKSVYESIRQEEVVMPYWIESSVRGQNIVLVGAGGVASMTSDGGDNWVKHNMKTDNGIFDVALSANNTAIVAGAVGTVAMLKGAEWEVADRSGLNLIAWLKSVVILGDDSYLVAGGRGSLVLYKNKAWSKLNLRSMN
tara:strand:- start:17 stop:1183 length:1167 start_codon:yes stop_codon:yes gene_type:complete